MNKLKSQEAILVWFGDRDIPVREVLDVTDNRIFWGMYKKGIFVFDNEQGTYRKKEKN